MKISKAWGIAVLKRNAGLRRAYRAGMTYLRYGRYRWLGRGTSDPALVTFECFVGRSYAGSPRALYEAMLADPRYAQCRFVWVFRDPAHAGGFPALADPRTTIVGYRTTEYYRAFSRAKVWITNSITAPELIPRSHQTYVQTWHGTPLKRIGIDVVATTETAMNGKDEIDDRYRAEARKVSTFISPSDFATACFASAFDLEDEAGRERFAQIGNPRNDALANATADDVAAARDRLGIPAGKRTVLYAPTWRDDQHDSRSGYVYTPPLDIAALRQALGEDHVLLFRMHYLVTNVIDFAAHDGFVQDVSGVDEVNEVLLASDVLITDYSSVYFDYAVLDRPMVFFMYDRDRYGSALRGFYLPLEQVPGPIVETQDALLEALLDPNADTRDAARRRELTEQMSPLDDGRASSRVLDMLTYHLGG